MMFRSILGSLTVATTVAAVATFAALSPAGAAMDEPVKPNIDCSKPVNKEKPVCAPKNGNYKEALAVAALARNTEDPRILRVTGFATRKLGDVDDAMPYYQKALAINPDDTRTRQYMGEAFISKGDMRNANAQLDEIAERCGKTCED